MATQRLIHSKPRKLKLERSWDLLSYSDYGTTRVHIKTLFPEPHYRHTIYNSHVLVRKSSSLEVLACLCDIGRQFSQLLLSVSFEDITIPPLSWHSVDHEPGISGNVFRSDYILLLFGLVEAELGPHRNDAVEDREGSAL